LPGRKRDRTRFLARVERFGEVIREDHPEPKQALVSSPLEPDLLAEALDLEPSSVELRESPERLGTRSGARGRSARSPYFGQIAVELGFISAAQREEILARSEGTKSGRSFGATAVAGGYLTQEQLELIRVDQIARLADWAAIQHVATDGDDLGHDSEGGGAGTDSGLLGAGKRADTVRVSVSVLDKLMNLAGELVLGRNQMRQLLDGVDVPGIKSVLQNVDLITAELQENIMSTRMQAIRVLFDRLPRLVRDLSQSLGKQVDLELIGGDVELDRSIIEALADPMTHMLRNALDHGIETPEGREALGKSPRGKVTVRAYHQRGRVVIDLRDDGRGIDLELVKELAIKRGLLSRDAADGLSESDLRGLVFEAGLSTANAVSDVSGRGVGMDVLRTNVESLGGQVELESVAGEGTFIRIHLPLTLAIIPSLIVSVADERFAIPQVNLVEVVSLREGNYELERIRDIEVLRLRGRLLPLVQLASCLGLPHERTLDDAYVVVLRCGTHLYGLAVDELQGPEEIVVKPLSSYLADCSWYAGATILGDGRVAMILDAAGIARRAALRFDEVAREELLRETPDAEPAARLRSLVLFANAAGEHFALPLCELSRLERAAASQVERVGEREFLQVRGRTIPLIRLEDVLPVRGGPRDEKSFFVLIPRAQREAGIVASRIVDTLDSDAQPDAAQISAPGLLGSAVVRDRLTLFLDTDRLLEAAGLETGG
jgi:two-component system chemotaxis sensor kinase CheA